MREMNQIKEDQRELHEFGRDIRGKVADHATEITEIKDILMTGTIYLF